MTSRMFLKKLQQEFTNAATEINDEGESILDKPDISSLNMMFEVVLTKLQLPDFKIEDVSVEAITQAFANFGLDVKL